MELSKNMVTYTLITGASRGIGREFAKVFAKKGNNLILRNCYGIKLTKMPQDYCRQATWENRRNACGLSRFYHAAWRQ